jgi:dihydrofolate reductase
MRRIVVTEFMSIDGVIEDPGGSEGSPHGGWAFKFESGDEGNKFKLDETLAADGLLLGRITYEGFAKAWPTIEDEAGFADKMNGMPKYVASSTLTDPEWNNSQVIEGDVAEAAAALKEEDGGDILVAGSGQLVRTLLEHDLVDEVRLMIYPVVLGGGKRLFEEGTKMSAFELAESRPVGDDGVLLLVYRPRAEAAS